MMKFQYEALDNTGEIFRDVIDADDEESAERQIREKGLFPTRLKPVRDDHPDESGIESRAGCFGMLLVATALGTAFFGVVMTAI